jgi:hypothetical protein
MEWAWAGLGVLIVGGIVVFIAILIYLVILGKGMSR